MSAGIYMILNKINNKKYIGQSWDLKRRKSEELKELRGNKFNGYSNHPLQNAYNLYGEESFDFIVIHSFETITEGCRKAPGFSRGDIRPNVCDSRIN